MILGRIIEQVSAECRNKNDNYAYVPFLIISHDPYSLLGHNSRTIRNILLVLGRIIEQVNMECHMQERQLCLSSFSKYVPCSIFLLRFFFFFVYGGSATFHNISRQHHRKGQYGVLNARMTTLLVFIF